MNLLAVGLAYLSLFVGCEWVYRARDTRPEVARRYVHLLSGLLTIAASLWVSRDEIIGLAVCFGGVLALSKRYELMRSVHAIRRTTWGEVFFPLGVGLAAVLYLPRDPQFYYLALLILSCSDPLANWLGGRLHSPALLFGKTLGGSLAFFLSSLVIALIFLEPGRALLVAMGATVGEALGPQGSDNVAIIPAVGLPLLFT